MWYIVWCTTHTIQYMWSFALNMTKSRLDRMSKGNEGFETGFEEIEPIRQPQYLSTIKM